MSTQTLEDQMPEPEPPTPKRVMTLTEIADYLDMRRSNVRKFLERRDIHPAFEKRSGSLWDAEDIKRVKRERDGDERRQHDEVRRATALETAARRAQMDPDIERMGRSMKNELLRLYLYRRVTTDVPAEVAALRRLKARGFVRTWPGNVYGLTTLGRRAARKLIDETKDEA